VLVSTLATMAVTALVLQAMTPRRAPADKEGGDV
jgi:hypothetical protein